MISSNTLRSSDNRKTILRNPKDLETLKSISLIDFSSLLWSSSKTTSFYLDKNRIQQLQIFAKEKGASKSGLISQAVYEHICTQSKKEFKPCKNSTEREKMSISLPANILELIREYAKKNNVSDSIFVNTSICSFLERYK